MPTIFTVKGKRFFFFSNERNEPVHVHVETGEKYAKFWLHPISLAFNHRFNSMELNRIAKIIEERKNEIEDKWNEYFNLP